MKGKNRVLGKTMKIIRNYFMNIFQQLEKKYDCNNNKVTLKKKFFELKKSISKFYSYIYINTSLNNYFYISYGIQSLIFTQIWEHLGVF